MKHSNFKFSGLMLFVLLAHTAWAADNIEIMSAEGSVTVAEAEGKDSKPAQSKSLVNTGNIVATGADARAVVKVASDGYVVMGKNSKVEITQSSKDKPGFFRQISGAVYYAINSIKGKGKKVEVRTATTTIGIRGTRFIVTDTDDRKEIGMRKGVVNVESVNGDFEIHKKSAQDEFEAYKREGAAAVEKTQREFEEYKQKTEQEFVEFKKEFSLSADRMATFDGKKVEDKPLSGETKKDMESLEEFAENWVKQVHD